jgi:limonene-1,2-epoxide hydrolase
VEVDGHNGASVSFINENSMNGAHRLLVNPLRGVRAMTSSIGDKFIKALNAVETNGNLQEMTRLFSENCQIWNVMMNEPMIGTEGAQKFWDQYKKTFQHIHSDFTHRAEGERTVVLEWNSVGNMPQDQKINYSGATIFEHDGNKITSFRSYFDTKSVTHKMH